MFRMTGVASIERVSGSAPPRAEQAVDSGGVALGAAAYLLWGLFPAFWTLLEPAGAIEILAHRIAWTMVLMAGVLAVMRGWRQLRRGAQCTADLRWTGHRR